MMIEKGVFGIPLAESIKYAHSSISYIDDRSGKQCFGVIPTVIAKCGSFLKDEGLQSKGIFRLCGNAKRIGLLQTIFDTPDEEYGAKLEWRGYTTYDAASILRRFLNYLPEPVITHEYYKAFRDMSDARFESEEDKVASFQKLIERLPMPNQYLLLYLLDLLGVYALHSATTLMDVPSLAVIFTPGILCHPDDKLNPASYKASQRVIQFLVEHQSQFLMPEISDTQQQLQQQLQQQHQQRQESSAAGDSSNGNLHLGRSRLAWENENKAMEDDGRRHTDPWVVDAGSRKASLYSTLSSNSASLGVALPCEDRFAPSVSVASRRKNTLMARGIKRSKTAPSRRRRYDSPQVVHVNRYPSQGQ
ncbi:Rho GTPase activation protein [Zychaea mexicana]|uniref:Rho GTPase activation protein n=1 Tax=Zychaea mexicana TaxID=64656 RepID=UPI0022FF09FF|nr:Rho GTPase activation protein [Zychaea mexicana]KAI9491634.1 Rho GTPase activation protein [Zychaea mexicana]